MVQPAVCKKFLQNVIHLCCNDKNILSCSTNLLAIPSWMTHPTYSMFHIISTHFYLHLSVIELTSNFYQRISFKETFL